MHVIGLGIFGILFVFRLQLKSHIFVINPIAKYNSIGLTIFYTTVIQKINAPFKIRITLCFYIVQLSETKS